MGTIKSVEPDSSNPDAGGSPQFNSSFFAFFLLLAYPFLGMIWHQSYPLLTLELLVYLSFAAGAALVMAVLVRRVRGVIAYVIFLFWILIVLMLQFNLRLEGTAIVLIASVLLLALCRLKTPDLLIPVLLALIAGAYLDARIDFRNNNDVGDEIAGNPVLPPVIHLVMDAFIGPAGIPDGREGALTRSGIRDFAETGGFALFPKAYSRYSSTMDSLSHAFNFRADQNSLYTYNRMTGAENRFDENEYFEMLGRLGYRIKVYQNEEMDFCQRGNDAMDACWTYTLPDLNSVRVGIDSPWLRTRLLFQTMLRQSGLIDTLVRKYQLVDVFGVAVFKPGIFAKMLEDIERRPAGVAYFAHILFPHSPSVYRSDCTLDYQHEPWARFPRMEEETFVSEEMRDKRYQLYLQQSRCALTRMESFFSELRSMGLYDDAIIIIHGDHGPNLSRVPVRVQFMQHLEKSDLRDTFSILFVLKSPFTSGLVINEAIALEELMEQTASLFEKPAVDAQELRARFEPGYQSRYPSKPRVYVVGQVPLAEVEVDFFSR